MRFEDFNKTPKAVDEVAMNPGAYAQSIKQAQSQGVLVGFEFEVCVPEATIESGKTSGVTNLSLEQCDQAIHDAEKLSYDDVDDISIKTFDKLFKIKDGVGQYPSAQAAYEAELPKAIERARAEFEKIPVNIRTKIVPVALKDSKNNWMYRFSKELAFTYQISRLLGYFTNALSGVDSYRGFKIEDSMAQLRDSVNDALTWPGLIGAMTGENPEAVIQHMSRYFDYDPKAVYYELDLDEDDDDDEGGRDDYDYSGAVKVLEPALQAATGKEVHVFNRYHEKRKNMTDWYIEPDGSLRPETPDDGAAEIVGPPEAPQQALASLKAFYSMAKQLNLYTNSSTGLHINVSIPAEIDVLKLAVFTGDQYVLQSFGRENNSYARSVYQQLSTPNRDTAFDIAKGIKTPDRKTNVFAQKKLSTKLKLSVIQKIANDVSGSHTASISSNGQYISFRQAGGDYLNQYQQVVNVVGRFVRAMVIAADPNAYRQEYLKAVVKLVAPQSNLLSSLQKTGLPVGIYYVYKNKGKWDDLVGSLASGLGFNEIQNNSEAAKQKVIPAIIASGDYSTAHTDNVKQQPVNKFATITFVPNSNNGVQMLKNAAATQDQLINPWYGFGFLEMSTLPPTDPRVQDLIMQLRRDQVS